MFFALGEKRRFDKSYSQTIKFMMVDLKSETGGEILAK